MNPLEALSLEQLQLRSSWKWQTYPPDVLPLWVAEMDVPLAPPVAEALHRAVEFGDTGYPTGNPLGESFLGFAARRWQWNSLRMDDTVLVPDVMNGFGALLQVVTDPGDSVVVNPPVYSPFYAYTAHHARRTIEAPLDADGRIDLPSLEEAFATARKQSSRVAYLLSSPHNPTGTVHTAEELAGVVALARQHDVTVISDEIHAPLTYPESPFTPLLTVAGSERFFALTSASKAWNLAGAKAAILIGGPEAADDLARVPSWLGRCASHLGVIAHTAAFNEGEDWLDDLLTGLQANRTHIRDYVADQMTGIRYLEPQGTFMAWLDCRQVPTRDEEDLGSARSFSDMVGPAKLFLDQARVALSSGHVFGPGGAGHVRLNFATSRAILTEALDRMTQALRQAR